MGAQKRLGAGALRRFHHLGDFLVRVGDEAVDGDDRRHAELAHVLQMPLEVVAALGDGGGVLVLQVVLDDATVHLERAHGGDDDSG